MCLVLKEWLRDIKQFSCLASGEKWNSEESAVQFRLDTDSSDEEMVSDKEEEKEEKRKPWKNDEEQFDTFFRLPSSITAVYSLSLSTSGGWEKKKLAGHGAIVERYKRDPTSQSVERRDQRPRNTQMTSTDRDRAIIIIPEKSNGEGNEVIAAFCCPVKLLAGPAPRLNGRSFFTLNKSSRRRAIFQDAGRRLAFLL